MFARLRHTMLPNLALRRIAAGIAVSLGLSVSGGDPDASPFRRIAASEPAPKEADSVAAIVAEYVDALISDRHLTSVQRERSLPRAFLLGGTHMACLCRRACPCGPRRRRYRGF